MAISLYVKTFEYEINVGATLNKTRTVSLKST